MTEQFFQRAALRFLVEPAFTTGQGQHRWSSFLLLCLVKCLNQPDMIFTRLQGANSEDKGMLQAEFVARGSQQYWIGNALKVRTDAVGNDDKLFAGRLKVFHQRTTDFL